MACTPSPTRTIFASSVTTITSVFTTTVRDGLLASISTGTSTIRSTVSNPILTEFATCPAVTPSTTSTTSSSTDTSTLTPSSSFRITISTPPPLTTSSSVVTSTSNGNIVFSTSYVTVAPTSSSSSRGGSLNGASSGGGGGSTNVGAIVGGVVGGVAAFALVLLAGCYSKNRRREREERERQERKAAARASSRRYTNGGKAVLSGAAYEKRKSARQSRRDYDNRDEQLAFGNVRSQSYRDPLPHRRTTSEPQMPLPIIPPSPELSSGRAGVGARGVTDYASAAAAVVGGVAPPAAAAGVARHNSMQHYPADHRMSYPMAQRPGPNPYGGISPGHSGSGSSGESGGYQQPYGYMAPFPPQHQHLGHAPFYGPPPPQMMQRGPGPMPPAQGPASYVDRRLSSGGGPPQQQQPSGAGGGWYGFLTGPQQAAADQGRYPRPQQPDNAPAPSMRTGPPSYTTNARGGSPDGLQPSRSQRSLNRVAEEDEASEPPLPSPLEPPAPSGRQPLPPNGTRAGNTRRGSAMSSVDQWVNMTQQSIPRDRSSRG